MLNSERISKLHQLTKPAIKYEMLLCFENYNLVLSIHSSLSAKLLTGYSLSVWKAIDRNNNKNIVQCSQ